MSIDRCLASYYNQHTFIIWLKHWRILSVEYHESRWTHKNFKTFFSKMIAHKLSEHDFQDHVLKTLINRDFFSIQFTICLLQNWKSWKLTLTNIWKKIHHRIRVFCECFHILRQKVWWQASFMRRLSRIERDNYQKSIFVVFNQWKFEQIVRSKIFFKIASLRCFSSYSHKKWRRVKNDVQMSIWSLSISNDVFRISKFVDNVLKLH